jgi:hypothetical protein
MQVDLPVSFFVEGAVLSPDDLNRALYDTEQGRGVYSEANGGLDSGNLDPDFELRQEHLQPEQVVKSRYGGSWTTLDNMSDASGLSLAALDLKIPRRQALPGCGARVYVPFGATAIRWNVSWFWYITRWFGLDKLTDPDTITSQAQEVRTHVYVDGREIEALRREYPLTWFQRDPAAHTSVAGGTPWSTETEQASVINLSHLQSPQAESEGILQPLSVGFHEVFVGFYVKPVGVDYVRDNVQRALDRGYTVEKTLKIHQRFSVGSRNARVVAAL